MIASNIHFVSKDVIRESKIDVSGAESGLFQSLFGNDSREVSNFMQNHFQKCPVVIRGSKLRVKDILHDFLYDLNVKEMLENSASDEIQVWLSQLHHEKHQKPLESIKVPTADQGE